MEIFLKVPLTQWVLGTIRKMEVNGKDDSQSWGDYWYKTYLELGGKSSESGRKGCPQHAAFGLWRLGWIKGTSVSHRNPSIIAANHEYGKNAAYAVIALDVLRNAQHTWDHESLWQMVQDTYEKIFHEEPAKSNQGASKVAKILFDEGQILDE